MKTVGTLAVAGSALVLALGGSTAAHAQSTAQGDVTIQSASPKKPVKSGGKIVSKATFSNNKKTCVYLEVISPVSPAPVPIASKCSSASSGTVSASKTCTTNFYNTKVIWTDRNNKEHFKDSGTVYIEC